jgi:hypothetical protein
MQSEEVGNRSSTPDSKRRKEKKRNREKEREKSRNRDKEDDALSPNNS